MSAPYSCGDALRLTARVNDLLKANNGLVEDRRTARRAAETALAAVDEWRARAIRAESAIAQIVLADEDARDVREVFAETIEMRERPVVAEPPEQAEWAFGPWVTLKPGAKMIPGAFYEYSWSPGDIQRRESPIFAGVPDSDDRCRRAYRIGEWYDHDGTRECPLEVGAPHDWVGSSGRVHADVVKPGEGWLVVRRFRPIGAA